MERHEFRSGELVDMSGGTINHSLTIANIIRQLGNRLERSGCRFFDSNLRVRISRKTLYSYPDVTVVCGEPESDPDEPRGETVVNPRLVIEVLSPSTELFNRTKKFVQYQRIESFQEYVLVSQDEPRIETSFRHPDGLWMLDSAAGLDAVIKLRSLGIELPLAEVFAGIVFLPS